MDTATSTRSPERMIDWMNICLLSSATGQAWTYRLVSGRQILTGYYSPTRSLVHLQPDLVLFGAGTMDSAVRSQYARSRWKLKVDVLPSIQQTNNYRPRFSTSTF
ncbi:hypothetical protein FRB91_008198 [Serendipita sp. 411]|nr:hypothetical protein FRB91_008198 [Serendipita sp. 411]